MLTRPTLRRRVPFCPVALFYPLLRTQALAGSPQLRRQHGRNNCLPITLKFHVVRRLIRVNVDDVADVTRARTLFKKVFRDDVIMFTNHDASCLVGA